MCLPHPLQPYCSSLSLLSDGRFYMFAIEGIAFAPPSPRLRYLLSDPANVSWSFQFQGGNTNLTVALPSVQGKVQVGQYYIVRHQVQVLVQWENGEVCRRASVCAGWGGGGVFGGSVYVGCLRGARTQCAL